MYEQYSVLAVVCARGGSKGVEKKNLREIGGVPMVALVKPVIEVAGFVDRAIISTDDLEIAEASGLESPFVRPSELATDTASAVDVARHALTMIEQIDAKTYDIILYLEPTAPFRKAEHLSECVSQLTTRNLDAVWTVSPIDPSFHPGKLLKVEKDFLEYYEPRGARIVARQQLETLYRRNGICYALTRRCLIEHGFMAPKTGTLTLREIEVSIDSELDIELANFRLSKESPVND